MDNSHGREHTSQTAVQGRVPVNKSGEASPLHFVLSQEREEMGRRHIHHVRGGRAPARRGSSIPGGLTASRRQTAVSGALRNGHPALWDAERRGRWERTTRLVLVLERDLGPACRRCHLARGQPS